MLAKIKNHPALLYASDISDICRPLAILNISYFSHVQIDNNKKFSAICNNPDFAGHYLINKYYNADIHMAGENKLGNLIIWDALKFSSKSASLAEEATAFGVRHVFTIVEKNKYGSDFYHFATHLSSKSINQIYLANLDLLKFFVLHFKEKISQSKALMTAYNIKFALDLKSTYFSLNTEDNAVNFEKNRSMFIEHFASKKNIAPHLIQNPLQNNSFVLIHKDTGQSLLLSPQQTKCLFFLTYGYTAKQIAKVLKLSYRTVEHHIEKIKKILGCHNMKELLGIYSSQLIDIIKMNKFET